jgi:CheY-like chemotaxis protein
MQPRRRPAVLLIEPDDDSLDMYAEYLAQAGFDPIAIDDVDEGLRRAASADVIVSGIHVRASSDGIDLVRRLRADTTTRHKPIIVLTAFAGPGDRDRAHDAGCDLFLSKPCLPDALASELRRVLTVRSVPRGRPRRAAATSAKRKHRTA